MSEMNPAEEPKRTDSYRKDPVREEELRTLNELLAPIESEMTSRFVEPRLPVAFLVGAPRSGSTLLSLLLAQSGRLAYVSNFVARFWSAPHLGARIEQALGIRGIEREASDNWPSKSTYRFRFGVTDGWDGPHEFGYFWAHWFPFEETHKLEPARLATVDRGGLLRAVAALEDVYQKPLFFKFLPNTLQIEFLADLFPRSLFVVCRRLPLYNAQSLAMCRDELFGDRNAWFSLRPKEYPRLRQLDWHEQVVGQLASIQSEMDAGLELIPPDRQIEVAYGDVCEQPRRQVAKVLLAIKGLTEGGERSAADTDIDGLVSALTDLPESFETRDTKRLPEDEFSLLEETCCHILGADEEGRTP